MQTDWNDPKMAEWHADAFEGMTSRNDFDFLEAAQGMRFLSSEVQRLREALESIKKHQEFIGGNFAALGSIHRIATDALRLRSSDPSLSNKN